MDINRYPDGTRAKGFIDGWNSIPGSGPAPAMIPFARGNLTSDDQPF